jgi:hypothetical protein
LAPDPQLSRDGRLQPAADANNSRGVATLRRTLTLWDLVIYGIILIQPTAPMPVFGVVSLEARGHVVTAILIAMVAMLCTYGAWKTRGFRSRVISFDVPPEESN